MTTVRRRRFVHAPPDAVWSALADFHGIARWAANVDHSCAVTEQTSGVGSVRRVQIGRTALIESIETWEPGVSLSYTITGLPRAIRAIVTTWTLEPNAGRTDVEVRTDVDAGPRPPQRLVATLAGRRFAGAADEMLAGLATHVERTTVS